MHSYVDLYFTPESRSPIEISERLKAVAGLSFIMGPHDLVFDWEHESDFQERLSKIHEALKGTGVLYRIETVTEEPGTSSRFRGPHRSRVATPCTRRTDGASPPPPHFQWKGSLPAFVRRVDRIALQDSATLRRDLLLGPFHVIVDDVDGTAAGSDGGRAGEGEAVE